MADGGRHPRREDVALQGLETGVDLPLHLERCPSA